ncbi:hypothetical protein [Aeromonas veronii]|uniref:hypothetical protein n=1 Tax=Aeromonas veronii TaxID=654 RepID=UPI0024445F45|nr:hypothetical protein [Aeromonas veronii]
MKRYLTSSSLEYVHRTKKKVRKLMAERKLSQSKISKLTDIPPLQYQQMAIAASRRLHGVGRGGHALVSNGPICPGHPCRS